MTRDGLAALKVLVERGPTRLNKENPGVAYCIAKDYVQLNAFGVASITELGQIEHDKTKAPIQMCTSCGKAKLPAPLIRGKVDVCLCA